jgi:uncharacterized membrane-anchored protein
MGAVEVAFAVAVSLLAAACVILALVFAICWLWFALRRVLASNRPPTPEEDFWRAQRALDGPR